MSSALKPIVALTAITWGICGLTALGFANAEAQRKWSSACTNNQVSMERIIGYSAMGPLGLLEAAFNRSHYGWTLNREFHCFRTALECPRERAIIWGAGMVLPICSGKEREESR